MSSHLIINIWLCALRDKIIWERKKPSNVKKINNTDVKQVIIIGLVIPNLATTSLKQPNINLPQAWNTDVKTANNSTRLLFTSFERRTNVEFACNKTHWGFLHKTNI